jgi:hypothetical protein
MNYWDASAIIPLCVLEEHSGVMQEISGHDDIFMHMMLITSNVVLRTSCRSSASMPACAMLRKTSESRSWSEP